MEKSEVGKLLTNVDQRFMRREMRILMGRMRMILVKASFALGLLYLRGNME